MLHNLVVDTYPKEHARTNRYRNTFPPTSIKLLNAKSGREVIGEDGGIQWGALLLYILLLILMSLCYVVLCEYLPQEFPLW